MIYITGDCHANFEKLSSKHFPEQKEMTRDDFVIVCGDFGGIWDYLVPSRRETYWLDWLAEKQFTLLFVDGNHENFDRLKGYPKVKFHGGMAHKIKDNVYHLMRGYVFDLQGKKFFAFGGASSHDIQDGILKPEDYPCLLDCLKDYNRRTKYGKMVRIKNISWWPDEMPTTAEMNRGIRNLEKVNYDVDFVISHCLPQDVCAAAGYRSADKLTMYFNGLVLEHKLKFYRWYCGHYHREDTIFGKFIIKYGDIERIV